MTRQPIFYLYQSFLYCEPCGTRERRRCDMLGLTPRHPESIDTYSPDTYPQPIRYHPFPDRQTVCKGCSHPLTN